MDELGDSTYFDHVLQPVPNELDATIFDITKNRTRKPFIQVSSANKYWRLHSGDESQVMLRDSWRSRHLACAATLINRRIIWMNTFYRVTNDTTERHLSFKRGVRTCDLTFCWLCLEQRRSTPQKCGIGAGLVGIYLLLLVSVRTGKVLDRPRTLRLYLFQKLLAGCIDKCMQGCINCKPA